MRTSSVASLFGSAGLVFLALTLPGMGETIPGFEPPVLVHHNTAFAQQGSCPGGKTLKLTCAIRGLDHRKVCVSVSQQAVNTRTFGQAPTERIDETENVKPVFQRAISTIPGKTLTAVVVSYPPGGKSLPHRHARSAFIYAFVLSGTIRSAIGSERPAIYHAGESFYEEPGAHHTVSENASKTRSASLLAVFVVDAEDHPLTLPDPSAERQ